MKTPALKIVEILSENGKSQVEFAIGQNERAVAVLAEGVFFGGTQRVALFRYSVTPFK